MHKMCISICTHNIPSFIFSYVHEWSLNYSCLMVQFKQMDVSLLLQLTIHSLLINYGVIGHNHLSAISSKSFDHEYLRSKSRVEEDQGYVCRDVILGGELLIGIEMTYMGDYDIKSPYIREVKGKKERVNGRPENILMYLY